MAKRYNVGWSVLRKHSDERPLASCYLLPRGVALKGMWQYIRAKFRTITKNGNSIAF